MKHSLTDHAGYLIIDHSSSPGLTAADLASLPGHAPQVGAVGEGQVFEADVLTCAHCQRGVLLNPERTRPRGYCRQCDHYICDAPGCALDCTPFAKLLDEAQTRAEHGLEPTILLTDC